MVVDGLHSTRPIEFKMADDPHDIEALFDAITYRKGASVLRMVEQYLHPDVFRAGVREYLRQHAYANATTDDLWVALGRQPAATYRRSWRAGSASRDSRLSASASTRKPTACA